MSSYDIDYFYRKIQELDSELKSLKQEVGEIKFITAKPGHGPAWVGVFEHITKPAQWPNEPYIDYLKRIGEYNEAQVYEDDTK